jgi:hypothetical protein
LMAAAYVLPGSLALALSRERTGWTWAVLWGCAVGLMTVVVFPVGGFLAIVVGLLYGSLAFGAWMSVGFLLLHFFTPNRRTARL